MRLASIIGCVLQQGKQITTEVSDLPKVTGGDHNTAGMLNQALIASTACTQPACLSPAAFSGCSWSKNGWGEGVRFGSLFFIQKKANYFPKGLLASALTFSPQRIFWMFFACLFSHVFCGGEGGSWVAPELPERRLSVLFPGESNLSCPQARWQWPYSLHWPNWTGQSFFTIPCLIHSHLLMPVREKGIKKSLIKGCLFCMLLPVVWGSQRSYHTISCSCPCLHEFISKHPCFVNI